MKEPIVKRLFRWSPSLETGVAALTVVLITLLAYVGINLLGETILNPIIFCFLGTFLVCVVFPLYWTVVVKKKRLDTLGITKERWLPSLIVSAVGGAFSLFGYHSRFGIDSTILPSLTVAFYAFWEVIFVYGWFQLRMEKAFGIVPSIVLASAAFALYHAGYGWYVGPDYINFFIIAIILGIIFRFTKNILILWPLLWPFSCLHGFAMGGFSPDWVAASVSGFVLVLMLISVLIFHRLQRRMAAREEGKEGEKER